MDGDGRGGRCRWGERVVEGDVGGRERMLEGDVGGGERVVEGDVDGGRGW